MAGKQHSAEEAPTYGGHGGSLPTAETAPAPARTNASANAVMYVNNSIYKGFYAYLCNALGLDTGSAYMRSLVNVAGSTTVRGRFYFAFNTLPTAGNTPLFYRVSPQAGGTSFVHLRLTSTGAVQLVDFAGTVLFTSSLLLQANNWYRIDINVFIGSGTADGRVGLKIVKGDAALSTSNSSTEAYYYNGACNMGAANGVSYVDVGKINITTTTPIWSTAIWIDDWWWDDTAWSTTLTSWMGASPTTPTTKSDIFNARATPGLSVASAFGGAISMGVIPAMLTTASPLIKPGALVLGAVGDALVVNPSVSRLYSLSMAAVDDALFGGQAIRTGVLPMTAPVTLALARAPSQLSATLPLAAPAALVNNGLRGTVTALALAAGVQASIGRLVDVQAVWAVNISSGAVFAFEAVQSGFFEPDAKAAVAFAALKVLNPALAVRGVPALGLAGGLDVRQALAVRGTPVLALAGLRQTTGVLVVRAAPGLGVAGRLTISVALPMSVIARMIHFGASIGQVILYDDVLSLVLRSDVEARLLGDLMLSALFDNGVRLSNLFEGRFQASVLPGGTIAVIQE